jgi:soluble lytic murein transglycosylase-like protein
MITLFESISTLVGLPSGLLAALCSIESNHNHDALRINDGGRTSSIGACQMKYKTAKEVIPDLKPSDLFKPEVQVRAAALYLKKKIKKYKKLDLAIAAYNTGSVKYTKGPLKELINKRYVVKVKKEWKRQKLKVSLAKVS